MDDKKICAIALLGFILAIAAYSSIQSPDIAFEVVVNNTNLAPTFPGEPTGTGERLNNTKYYTNTSPIELFVWAHANAINQNARIILNINGTNISETSGRPLGGAEESAKQITAIIPKFSNYTVYIDNIHHYEWREYQILSGKNGTLSINQTVVYQNTSSGISFNGSPVNLNGSSFYNGSQQFGTFNHANLTNLDWSVAGHIMDTDLNMNNHTIINLSLPNVTSSNTTGTGGTITYVGAYTIHTFTSNGTFVPAVNVSVEYLIIAGGGGGGRSNTGGFAGAAGGGAGGWVTNLNGTKDNVVKGVGYPVVIGSGGAAQSTASTQGNNGTNSTFNNHTALGGGGGGSAATNINGFSGGSGGGGAYNNGVPGSGSQGYSGGISIVNSGGGGGGGANMTGFNAPANQTGGWGGDGNYSIISGSKTAYAAGGGGGVFSTFAAGNGGIGGGGQGGANGAAGLQGTPNTGSGGGGGGTTVPGAGNGGAGGSGIVIIRYLTAQNYFVCYNGALYISLTVCN